MEPLTVFLREFGFPVFVAGFLLLRIEPTLKEMNLTMARMLQFLQDKREIPKGEV